MKRSAGFTLIELIIVIVILGILAVTAAPKFINMQNEARISTVNSMKGAVESASTMVYSKAIIKGVDKSKNASTVTIDGSATVDTVYGYPAGTTKGIVTVVESTDWSPDTSTAGTVVFTPKGFTPATAGTCSVKYVEATGTTAATGAVISADTTGC